MHLATTGDKKIQVIKVVRAATGLGLKEAKALVDEAPEDVKEGLDREEAERLKQELEEAGATVELNSAARARARRGPRIRGALARSARPFVQSSPKPQIPLQFGLPTDSRSRSRVAGRRATYATLRNGVRERWQP